MSRCILAHSKNLERATSFRRIVAGPRPFIRDFHVSTLGEIYGRFPELAKLVLHWRRVRSNLDDEVSFAASVSYLPRRVRMEVARSEMLSLLIRPLYGDDPSFGVRELIQNAVDAVREREYFQSKNPEFAHADVREQDADVVVWLADIDVETQTALFEVSDRGIGMTARTLTDYFLTAGASYRHSEQWQRTFERTDSSEDKTIPRAQVVRAGHFGIGALGAFLLGDALEVETRHITSPVGLRFTMCLSEEAIQIERVPNMPVGTLIRTRVAPETFEKLANDSSVVSKPGRWDWYVLAEPSVLRLKGSERKPLAQNTAIDLQSWSVAETTLPMTIHWTYEAGVPALSCNGIFVSNAARLPKLKPEHCGCEAPSRLELKTPNIHVTDRDGHLALNLTRKEISNEEYGFEPELALSVLRDYFAALLVLFPEDLASSEIEHVLERSPFVLQAYTVLAPVKDCLLTPGGFCLPFNHALTAFPSKLQRVLCMPSADLLGLVSGGFRWDCIVIQDGLLEGLMVDAQSGMCTALTSRSRYEKPSIPLKGFRSTMNAAARRKTDAKAAKTAPSGSQEIVEKTGTWKDEYGYKTRRRWFMEKGEAGLCAFPFDSIPKEMRRGDIPHVAELVLEKDLRASISAGLLDHWWQHFFGNDWIPWKKADRRDKFPRAYDELAAEVARYEK